VCVKGDTRSFGLFCENAQVRTGFRKPGFKKCNPLGLNLVLLGFGLYWFFRFFYLNEQFGSLFADLPHQLSFYLDSPVLQII